jgi:hypothetical protein
MDVPMPIQSPTMTSSLTARVWQLLTTWGHHPSWCLPARPPSPWTTCTGNGGCCGPHPRASGVEEQVQLSFSSGLGRKEGVFLLPTQSCISWSWHHFPGPVGYQALSPSPTVTSAPPWQEVSVKDPRMSGKSRK